MRSKAKFIKFNLLYGKILKKFIENEKNFKNLKNLANKNKLNFQN